MDKYLVERFVQRLHDVPKKCPVPARDVAPRVAVRIYASQIMLIKDGLSSYRDAVLTPADEQLLRKLVKAHLEWGLVNVSRLDSVLKPDGSVYDWTPSQLVLNNAMHAQLVLDTPRSDPRWSTVMNAYHTSTGYDSYTHAQDAGIEQCGSERW